MSAVYAFCSDCATTSMALPTTPTAPPRQKRRRKVPFTDTNVPGSSRSTAERTRARDVTQAIASTGVDELARSRADRSTITVKDVIVSPLGSSFVRT